MESSGRSAGARTPVKEPQAPRSKIQEISKVSENFNPNVTSPGPKPSGSSAIKSAKSQKSASRIANPVVPSPPRNRIRERKFIVLKKNPEKERAGAPAATCKCKEKVGGNAQKCLCIAYENLRASQDEFFKNQGSVDAQCVPDPSAANCEKSEAQIHDPKIEALNEVKAEEERTNDPINEDRGENETASEAGSASVVRKRRNKLLEEARDSVPEPGSGRVMHLVQAFERILSIPKSKDPDQKDDKEEEEEETRKGVKWPLPGFQPKAPPTDDSLSSFCPSELFLASKNLRPDCRVWSSWDSSQGSISISGRTSCGRRSRRNSSDSSGTNDSRNHRRRQLRITSQKPFKLRTEQRGRQKEKEFIRKVQEIMLEEEKRRIPIAQGLPWTTDEPECLVKPSVKDYTKPLDVRLHSDVRAVERAEFDHQVAEKLSLVEQYRMERERQQRLEEEVEIRRLRKELIPKAQPMPYFDRPFIPKRSMKDLTIPKEPKFRIPHNKKIKCCLSWSDINIYDYHQ